MLIHETIFQILSSMSKDFNKYHKISTNFKYAVTRLIISTDLSASTVPAVSSIECCAMVARREQQCALMDLPLGGISLFPPMAAAGDEADSLGLHPEPAQRLE